MTTMNLIRQRIVSLRSRAIELQTCLRRWALYDDRVPADWKEALLGRLTPAEETAFESDLELTPARLRPASAQIQTVIKWYDFVLQHIGEQLDRAIALYEQNRVGDCAALLCDIERRLIEPNEETLGYFFRCLAQHASHEYHQKLAAIDAVIRALYLPTAKLAHQRGLLSREGLSLTPLAYLADGPDAWFTWRHHARQAASLGRPLPVSLLAVPRRLLAEPWNLVAIAHEAARCIATDLGLMADSAARIVSIGAATVPVVASAWPRWHESVFADILATIKLGPAYAGGMIELLGAQPAAIALSTPASDCPPPLVRWQIMIQSLHLLNHAEPAREMETHLRRTFGDFEHFGPALGAAWGGWLVACRRIVEAIAFNPFQRLAGARLVDVAQPFMAAESQAAAQVRDLLLAGDATIASDDSFRWIEPLAGARVPAHVALAGLALAHRQAADLEASRRLWVRFWCLLQYLSAGSDEDREKEDRDFAPADATLRQLASRAVPPAAAPSPAALPPAAPWMSPLPSPVFGAPAMPAASSASHGLS
jgi:hypothetical protein